jgi:hypothetical protein
VVLLEKWERQFLADRQGMVARGATERELPVFSQEREGFDARLAAEPEPVTEISAEQMELRRALKVA